MIPNLGEVYVPTQDGHFVSETQMRISEILAEYDPDLFLAWIPPEKRKAEDDKPFAVVHCPVGRPSYVVLYAEECDERILHRIIKYDGAKNNVLKDLEKVNTLAKKEEKRKGKTAMDEAADVAKHILASPKTTYIAEGYKYYTHQPAEKVKK